MSGRQIKATRSSSRRSRPTIGVFIGRIGDQRYQADVWPGIADAAEERNVNLVCFVGRELESPDGFEAQRNAIYDLAGLENVDGLVTLSGTLGHYIGPERLKRFYERFSPLPMVSIALALDDMPSVIADNDKGMRDAISHLIEVHRARRIAFIRGPESSPEAEQRYRTYRETLDSYGLPFEPALVAPADFNFVTGAAAIRLLLDERKVTMDAVVAANDESALGAMSALQERGIRVPDDVSVVGFDDIEEAAFSAPPLTTARQPLYEQGKQATEMLLALLAGEEIPKQVVLPTKLVVRQSCGCFSPTVLQAEAGLVAPQHEALASISSTRLQQIIRELGRVPASTEMPGGWAERLVDAFFADLRGKSSGAFLSAVRDILQPAVALHLGASSLQNAISVLRRFLLPYLENGETLHRAEDLWHQARVLIGETVQWTQANQRLQAVRRALMFGGISESLMSASGLEELPEVLARDLPAIGIKSCYLSLYEPLAEGDRASPPEWARLILAYNENGRVKLEPGGRRFPSRQLVPDGILPSSRRYTVMVEPLRFRDEAQLGFIILESAQPEGGLFFETLSRQISTTLRGILLSQQRRQAEEALAQYSARLEEMVEERTRELREAQEQLVRREKLAVLGQLAGGVGHELRNPLGVISNAVYFLQMTLADADETTQEYLGILASEVHNAEKIVSDLLDFARAQQPEREEVSVEELVEQVLKRQPPPEGVAVATEFEEGLPAVYVDARHMGQVLGNLVSNAYQAIEGGGRLEFRARVEGGKVVLSVTDTGCGIPEENLEKIFEPLFTTRRRGIGLGLAISKNLVEVNGGSIEVSSEVGKGSTFTIRLPLANKEQ